MRFLPPETFHSLALGLIWQLTETAALQRSTRRSRPALALLWSAILKRCQKKQALAPAALPDILVLWLLARYFQVWGQFDGWQTWICVLCPRPHLLDTLTLLAPRLPGFKPATRRALLAFGLELLAPPPAPEVYLRQLGALAELAQNLKRATQADLLREEMMLLLTQEAESLPPRVAFELALQWVQQGEVQPARLAFQRWYQAFGQWTPEDQHWELGHCLSHLLLFLPDLSHLRLEQTHLLHQWLLRMAEWFFCQEDAEKGLLWQMLSLACAWGLPEAENWWEARLPLSVNQPTGPQPPLYRPLLLGYARALGDLAWAERLLAEMPLPLNCDSALIQSLYQRYWTRHEDVGDAAQIRLLHLQTLVHLLNHSRGKRRKRLRRQIRLMGTALLAPVRATHVKGLRKALKQLLRENTALLKQEHAWAHSHFLQNLHAAQELGEAWALSQDMLISGSDVLRDWITGILAYPADELTREDISLCRELHEAQAPGWPRWQMRLSLAQGLLAHRCLAHRRLSHEPGHSVARDWQACLDWSDLEGYEPLQACSGWALALSQSELPDKPAWFAKLAQALPQIDPEWQADCWVALGHCQIRAGDVSAGLQTLEALSDPEMALQAVLQVGSVLTESKQNDQYPLLMAAILRCVERVHQPQQKWQGYLAVAAAQALRGQPVEGVQTFLTGVQGLLPGA